MKKMLVVKSRYFKSLFAYSVIRFLSVLTELRLTNWWQGWQEPGADEPAQNWCDTTGKHQPCGPEGPWLRLCLHIQKLFSNRQGDTNIFFHPVRIVPRSTHVLEVKRSFHTSRKSLFVIKRVRYNLVCVRVLSERRRLAQHITHTNMVASSAQNKNQQRWKSQ